ncbi:MAG: YtxH domain-containing protein [Bacteroidales bacterium]
MKALSLITAFIGGAAAGAAIGLLFAPAKGSDTRACVADFMRKHGVNLNHEQIDELTSKIESKIKGCKEDV